MGVFNALTTAVSGMQAQSYALENISGNIANSRTAGFKRVDTSFSDLVPDTALNRQISGSVAAYSQTTNTIQGDLAPTGISTNVAINGDGYFVVDQRQSGLGSNMNFANKDLYTRRGDFDFDANGYLVNGAGYYLKGLRIDPVTGSLIGTQPEVLRITQEQYPAKKTTEIEYRANIPAFPATNAAQPNNPASALIDPTDFGGTINNIEGGEITSFLNQSIEGGSVPVYNDLGQATTVELRWAKVTNGVAPVPAQPGPPPVPAVPGVDDAWALFVAQDTSATGTNIAYVNTGVNITFDSTGKMTNPASGNIALPTMTINGQTITGINLVTGGDGLTQNGDSSGVLDARSIRQNGYTAGTLDRTEVSESGQLIGTFSNGQVVALAQLSVARFNAGNALKRLDGGTFEETIESGPPIIGLGTAQLVGGNVEQSNTDIADEFSKMIITQQAYSANTKVITTAQDMLSSVFNIIR